jgi:hypothetical protein
MNCCSTCGLILNRVCQISTALERKINVLSAEYERKDGIATVLLVVLVALFQFLEPQVLVVILAAIILFVAGERLVSPWGMASQTPFRMVCFRGSRKTKRSESSRSLAAHAG